MYTLEPVKTKLILSSLAGPIVQKVREELEPLWVSGLGLILVFIVDKAFNLKGEAWDWTQYLVLGTLFPGLILALALVSHFWQTANSVWQTIKVMLAISVIPLTGWLLLNSSSEYAILIALGQGALILFLPRLISSYAQGRLNKIIWSAVFLGIFSLSWIAAARLPFWMPPQFLIKNTIYGLIVFIVVSILILVNLLSSKNSLVKVRFKLDWLANSLALVFFAFAGFRTDNMFNAVPFHHWSVFVGTAQMVQQGGWLYWDIPSQYGFLSTLLMAFFPASNVWQSLYIIQALLFLVEASIIFFIFRSLRAGIANFLFAFGVTFVAVYKIPGYFPDKNAAEGWLYPATGPVRFIWCYVLIAVLLWGLRREVSHRQLFGAGCVVWVIGALWSVESMVYVSCIWLPAFAFLLLQRVIVPDYHKRGLKKSLLVGFGWLALPFVLLALALLGISLFYQIFLGHTPDWYGYIEYAFSGFFALPIDPTGSAWLFFLLFCAIGTSAVYFLRENLLHPALAPILGAFGLIWSTGSYFVGRSHPIIPTNLVPEMCTAIGVLLYLFNRYGKADKWSFLIKSSLAPFLIIIVTLVFNDWDALVEYAQTFSGYETQIIKALPHAAPELNSLFDKAQVKITDPIIDATSVDLLPVWDFTQADGTRQPVLTNQTWMPASPPSLFIPIAPARWDVYLKRYIERNQPGGWLVVRKNKEKDDSLFQPDHWLFPRLLSFYHLTEVFENEAFQLVWFDYKKPSYDFSANFDKGQISTTLPNLTAEELKSGISEIKLIQNPPGNASKAFILNSGFKYSYTNLEVKKGDTLFLNLAAMPTSPSKSGIVRVNVEVFYGNGSEHKSIFSQTLDVGSDYVNQPLSYEVSVEGYTGQNVTFAFSVEAISSSPNDSAKKVIFQSAYLGQK